MKKVKQYIGKEYVWMLQLEVNTPSRCSDLYAANCSYCSLCLRHAVSLFHFADEGHLVFL